MCRATITVLLISFLFPTIAHAVIGVSPARLEFDLEKGTALTQKIFLQNLDDSPRSVQIQLADRKFSDVVQIIPVQLILEPHVVTSVQTTVLKPLTLDTQLEIIESLPLNQSLGVVGGVKIPISVRVPGSATTIWKLIFSGLFAGLVTFSVFMILEKRFKLN